MAHRESPRSDTEGAQEFNPYDVYDRLDHTPRSLIDRVPSTSSNQKEAPDDQPQPPLSHVRKGGRKLSLRVLLATLFVVILTAGLAISIIVWFHQHRTESSLSEAYKRNAFLLDEGVTVKGDLVVARLMGLTIASAASVVVGLATPTLVGLYGFRTAQLWLSRGKSRGPTPIQYGLLLEMFAGASFLTTLNPILYLFKKRSRRGQVRWMFGEAVCVGVSSYVLSHAVSGMDLWLHATTTTVQSPGQIPLDGNFSYSIGQDTCPPYPADDFSTAVFPCLYNSGAWGGANATFPGMLVSSNTSQTLRAISLADADDLAVLVNPGIEQSISFRATSLGARSSCSLLTPQCMQMIDGYPSYSGVCSNVPPGFPFVNAEGTNLNGTQDGGSAVFMITSNCPTCPYYDSRTILSSEGGILSAQYPPENRYSLFMQFVWVLNGGSDIAVAPPPNTALATFSNAATMLMDCTLSFYNVTLDYQNGTYTRVNETLSNTGLSDGLAGPTRIGQYTNHLVANIEGLAYSESNNDNIVAFLRQDLSRLALGSAAIITDQTAQVLSPNRLVTNTLGRYPFWPTVLLVAFLLADAIFALIICLSSSLVSTEYVEIPSDEDGDGTTKQASHIELLQARLTRPSALVSDYFPKDEYPETPLLPTIFNVIVRRREMSAEDGLASD